MEPTARRAVTGTLLRPAKPGYSPTVGKRGVMRKLIVIAAALTALAAQLGPADAQSSTQRRQPPIQRSAAGTVIQPTRTIIHNSNGTTTIVTPRRSYLDTGTEVSVGDRGYRDYVLPPGGDPGRSSVWFYGPDYTNVVGGFMPARPFYLPGYNANTPY
jgi:hypothetical protein